jgi:HEAT repeat protein
MSPLRGLNAFAESEREVFYGRDRDIDALSRLVTTDGFRAGLLHGEPGVGKTSLLNAGLVPMLRDHGVVALRCGDIHHPVQSFMQQIELLTGEKPAEDEPGIRYLSRVVAGSVSSQLFLFILDDVEIALSGSDEAMQDLGDLFARVVTRSGGRARFLFCCASESVHRFGALEQRTGSLFPPTSRYELLRLAPADALMVLERTLSLAGLAADPQVSRVVVEALARSGPILPAELQIAAKGLFELRLTSPQALHGMGGPAELERAWIKTAAQATGQERTALRLLAELASDLRNPAAYAPEWAAARASVDPAFAAHALEVLRVKGVVRAIATEAAGTQYMLAHSILLPRIREIAALARETSRRAFELLGSKVETGKRLTLVELRDLRREGITPSTPQEHAVVERSKRFLYIAGGAALATPLFLLVIIFVLMQGTYYLDVSAPPGGGVDRVVVRSGRPGLSAFHWLPGSPSFGSVVADTGFSRPMVKNEAWAGAHASDLTGDLDDYASAALATLDPTYRNLLEYATSGSSKALEALRNKVEGPQDQVLLLEFLVPIARGTPDEVKLVESSLRDAAPSVQRSALRVAAAVAKRRQGAYRDTLAHALTSPDAELRRLALSAAHALDEQSARDVYRAALAANPEPGARRELVARVAAADDPATPSAASATSVLVNRDLPPATREKARNLLKRAFSAEPAAAAAAAAQLAADDDAPQEERILALELMRDFAPEDSYPEIADQVKETLDTKTEAIRAAALPLYARVAPQDAAAELVILLEREQLGEPLRVAMALGWGEVARATKDRAAAVALETLLKDESAPVRAAAAEAYGNVGRAAQNVLITMVKNERFDVAVGAAYGLANSAEVGASPSVAVSGIGQLWKRKGKQRRRAAEIYAHMARTNSAAVYFYLTAAARSTEDSGLHVIGVRGLCNASAAGNRQARKMLARAVDDSLVEVRRVVIECIVDTPGDPKTAADIAGALAGDVDSGIRMDAARVLASLAAEGKAPKPVADALTKLALDSDREVRMRAMRALARLGSEAPPEAAKALTQIFDRADESEKQVLLEAARSLGGSDVVQQAIADESPLVRVAALDTAIATGSNVTVIMNAAVTDSDRDVRTAALERLANSKDKIEQDALSKSLALAVRDPDPGIAQLALTTLARLGDSEEVAERLSRALAQRSEQLRAQAASATIGMVERDPQKTVELLSPLLNDPSHDVRAAMLPALAAAWNLTYTHEQLAAMLRGSEKHAMRRIAVTGAFLVLARTEAGHEAAMTTLAREAKKGPPMARIYAELAMGLIEGTADGIAFLQLMTP